MRLKYHIKKENFKKLFLYNIIFLLILLIGDPNAMALDSFLKKIGLVSKGEKFIAPKINGRILFISDRNGDRDLYVLIKGNLKKICSHVLRASWSPDGESIVCETKSNGILLIDKDGITTKQMINEKNRLYFNPTFFSDGNKILFESIMLNQSALDKKLFQVNINGSNMQQVTKDEEKDFSHASISPDGKMILFCRLRDPKDYNSRIVIYVMNADGSDIIKLTNNPNGDITPSWSPDGKNIVFASMREGDVFRQIYVMDRNGQNIKRITTSEFHKDEPCWSPDGRKICYMGYRRGIPFAYSELFVINLDGTEEQLLIDQIKIGNVWSNDSYPKWAQ